jgi:hypothetical protein
MDLRERKEGIENYVTKSSVNYSLFLLKFMETMTLRTIGLEVDERGMRDREGNKTGNVRIKQHCGVFL